MGPYILSMRASERAESARKKRTNTRSGAERLTGAPRQGAPVVAYRGRACREPSKMHTPAVWRGYGWQNFTVSRDQLP
jgi:hypothetical protein